MEAPKILSQVRSASGVAIQVRKDPRGVQEVPGLDRALISIHLGVPAKIACLRGGRTFSGTAVHGDIDIVPARTPARWEMLDDNDRSLLVALPRAMLHSVARDLEVPERYEILNRFQIRDPELDTIGWAMRREMESGCLSGRLYLEGLALAAASRLVASHSSAAARRTLQAAPGLHGRRLKQVLAFIEEQLAEDLSIGRIAAIAGISASHFKTQFRRSVGVPIHRYVIERRVEHARRLLDEDGPMSLTEIALAAGFANVSHLARHMRRTYGQSPGALKRSR